MKLLIAFLLVTASAHANNMDAFDPWTCSYWIRYLDETEHFERVIRESRDKRKVMRAWRAKRSLRNLRYQTEFDQWTDEELR